MTTFVDEILISMGFLKLDELEYIQKKLVVRIILLKERERIIKQLQDAQLPDVKILDQ